MPLLAHNGKDKITKLLFVLPFGRKDMRKGVFFMSNFKTAECVSPKHPDKICDQISDAILDAYLEKDPDSRVAVEAVGGHGKVFVIGEVTSKNSEVNIKSIVKRLAGDVEVVENIVKQSPEISRGVDDGGAGDQGIMVGYATDETAEMLPVEYVLARDLNRYLFNVWPYDGKTQITIADNLIHTIVASFQNVSKNKLEQAVRDWNSSQKIASSYPGEVIVHANPAGDWNIGGFDADTGLTGRKLIVDNYGPRIPIGGGAFSGKDPSKVDRSSAYMARKIAVDYLKRFQAHEVYVYLAYAIGYDKPVQATVIVDGIEKIIEGYDLSPKGIIKFLGLKSPIFEQTARYGHFGNKDFNWEK